MQGFPARSDPVSPVFLPVSLRAWPPWQGTVQTTCRSNEWSLRKQRSDLWEQPGLALPCPTLSCPASTRLHTIPHLASFSSVR